MFEWKERNGNNGGRKLPKDLKKIRGEKFISYQFYLFLKPYHNDLCCFRNAKLRRSLCLCFSLCIFFCAFLIELKFTASIRYGVFFFLICCTVFLSIVFQTNSLRIIVLIFFPGNFAWIFFQRNKFALIA